MNKTSNSDFVYNFCHTKCQSIKDIYKSDSGKKLILSNFGEISEDMVDSILYLIETKLEAAGERKGIIKRIFSIVVESLQNVRLHGTRDKNGKQTSFIIMSKVKNDYMISIASLADNKTVDGLRSKLNMLKKLNPNSLKKKYMNTLSLGRFSQKGGAGLGFITIAMKSENNISFEFDKINDNLSLFNLQVKVAAN